METDAAMQIPTPCGFPQLLENSLEDSAFSPFPQARRRAKYQPISAAAIHLKTQDFLSEEWGAPPVEDPIEFVHQSQKSIVNHREVGMHTQTFAAALRGALREDPDIILVGEMRDLETISLAIEAAATGHLVFGTLHTPSAAKTVDRVIDVFPAGQQNQIRNILSEALKGVVTQNLFRRIDKKGRVAALEILVVTTAIANLIREAKTFQIPGMLQVGKKFGMQTLDDAIAELLNNKVISPEEAYDKANDKNKFRALLKSPPEDWQ